MFVSKLSAVINKKQIVGVKKKLLFSTLPKEQLNDVGTTSQMGKRRNPVWEKVLQFEEIPTESKFQMIRNFLPGGKLHKLDFNELMAIMQKEHGNIFRWPAMWGKEEMVFTHNPEDFETIYRNEGIWPVRSGIETLAYYRSHHRKDFYQGTEGTITTQGEKWGKFRSAVNPVLMQPKTIKLYVNRLSDVNLDLIKKIRTIRDPQTLEVPKNFLHEINCWTFESIAMVALDKRLYLLRDGLSNETKQFFSNISEVLRLFYELDIKPSMWRYVATPAFKRMMNLLDDIQNSIVKHINDSISRLEEEKRKGVKRLENEKGVFEKLLAIDKKIATVMANDMLFGGIDTTSTFFVSIILTLAKNPEKQQKLREEVLKILPEKDSRFGEDALNNMPYLRACIKEAGRIYPLLNFNQRAPQNDVILGGYRVPKDKVVVMVFQSLLRNEKYFPHPDKYIPERWLRENNGNEMLKSSNPFVFLPFGFGPRMCLGKRIADMELEIGTARLIRNFYIEYNYPTDNAFKMSVINQPVIPLNFKFTDVEI